jgi:hypothetical protein
VLSIRAPRRSAFLAGVIVIRRLVDRRRAYTGLFLPGEPARIFPTSDHEHARILEIYKQDRAHDGILNDFTDYAIGRDALTDKKPAAITLRRGVERARDQPPAR